MGDRQGVIVIRASEFPHRPRGWRFSTGLAILAGTFLALTLNATRSEGAARLPQGFVETAVVRGLSNATTMAFAPDGRLFVCQQGGQVRIVKNGTLLPTPFVTVPAVFDHERGLSGIVFDPSFIHNGYVYLYFTAEVGGVARNRLIRVTAAGDTTVPGSEELLLELDPMGGAAIHNGGAMRFGRDGLLYIAVGDNAQAENAQSLQSLAGKILCVRSDGSIPETNPFRSATTGKYQAIWALGLRNPFTFDIDAGTGRMFINDVGQRTWEEVNEGIRGANYGWPEAEGPSTDPRFREPLFAYGHGRRPDQGCAIAGGLFYRPEQPQFPPRYQGLYLFADHCNGWIRTLDPVSKRVEPFATGFSFPVDLDLGPDGAMYVLSRGTESVHRIEYARARPPSIVLNPEDVLASVGQEAFFRVSASGSSPLRYQWQRAGQNIAGATEPEYRLTATLADHGALFRCRVTNRLGSAVSAAATLSVTDDQPPTATIATPVAGAFYRGGQEITYAGSGADPENGPLPSEALTWQVDFHHAEHTHPFLPATSGIAGGSFLIPTSGETATNVFYRVTLSVKDAAGLVHTTTRDIRPRVVSLRLESVPSGATLLLDGQPHSAPYLFETVAGSARTISAPSPQFRGSVARLFERWSDGGEQSHGITVPDSDATYTATFATTREPILTAVKLARPSVERGTRTRGEVLFNRPVRARATVALSSSNSELVRVPATVVVPRGSRGASFSIRLPGAGGVVTAVLIRATHGSDVREANLVVRP